MAKEKFDIYELVNKTIIELLESGTVPWHKPWNGGDPPANLISKKAYRGINVMLLGFKPYASPYWLTFNQAKKMGGCVKKGEKSTIITFWKFLEVQDRETGKDKTIPMLRYYRVFNVEQCELPEGKILEHVIDEHEVDPIDACEAVCAGYDGPAIEFKAPAAFYSPKSDTVNMPKRETFDDSEKYYSTLFHELVHSTGHESRLNRISGRAAFGSGAYSKEELVAEYGAAYICTLMGIENLTIDNSAAYINGWLNKLKGDKKLLVSACGAAQKAVDLMIVA